MLQIPAAFALALTLLFSTAAPSDPPVGTGDAGGGAAAPSDPPVGTGDIIAIPSDPPPGGGSGV
jgi:hypothetical protein